MDYSLLLGYYHPIDAVIPNLFQNLISHLVNISIPIRRNLSADAPIYRKTKNMLDNMGDGII